LQLEGAYTDKKTMDGKCFYVGTKEIEAMKVFQLYLLHQN